MLMINPTTHIVSFINKQSLNFQVLYSFMFYNLSE